MNREQNIQWLLEGMLDNPLFTPITVWLYLLNKMDSEELQVMVDIQKLCNAKELSDNDLGLIGIIVEKAYPSGPEREVSTSRDLFRRQT